MSYKFLSIADAARYIGITEKALRRRIDKGTGPPAMRSGRKIEIAEDVLLDWMKTKRGETPQPKKENGMKEAIKKGIDDATKKDVAAAEQKQGEVDRVREEYMKFVPAARELHEIIMDYELENGVHIRHLKEILENSRFEYRLRTGPSDGTRRKLLRALNGSIERMIGHLKLAPKLARAIGDITLLNAKTLAEGDHERAKSQIQGVGSVEEEMKRTTANITNIMAEIENHGGLAKVLPDTMPEAPPLVTAPGTPRKRYIGTPDYNEEEELAARTMDPGPERKVEE